MQFTVTKSEFSPRQRGLRAGLPDWRAAGSARLLCGCSRTERHVCDRALRALTCKPQWYGCRGGWHTFTDLSNSHPTLQNTVFFIVDIRNGPKTMRPINGKGPMSRTWFRPKPTPSLHTWTSHHVLWIGGKPCLRAPRASLPCGSLCREGEDTKLCRSYSWGGRREIFTGHLRVHTREQTHTRLPYAASSPTCLNTPETIKTEVTRPLCAQLS